MTNEPNRHSFATQKLKSSSQVYRVDTGYLHPKLNTTSVVMLHAQQQVNVGRAQNDVASKYSKRRTIRRTCATPPVRMTMMMVVVVVLTINIIVVHSFVPSTFTLFHPRHVPTITSDRSTTTAQNGVATDKEQMDSPFDLSTTDHDMTSIESSSSSSSSMNEIINLTNKDISQMSFRELQRHVRILMMNEHEATTKKAEEITRGMTTSILREKIRSLSNLCLIRDDGVEDCSFDDEQVRKQTSKAITKCT